MLTIPYVHVLPSVVSYTHTATDDNKFNLVNQDVWLREVNVHILTNDARYGDINITSSYPSITANNGLSFQDVNLKDFYFMNSTGGSNTLIIAVGVVMTDGRKRELGLI